MVSDVNPHSRRKQLIKDQHCKGGPSFTALRLCRVACHYCSLAHNLYSNFTLLTLTLTTATIDQHTASETTLLTSIYSSSSLITLHLISKPFRALQGDFSLTLACPVTRTNKGNDRNHSAIADGTALPEERLPRYFAKHGHVDADPKSVKKQGGGKGNWYDCLFTHYQRKH